MSNTAAHRSDAATAAGASVLNANWTFGSLKCTKPGVRGCPNILDLTKTILPNGSALEKFTLEEIAERLGNLVAACGNSSEMSAFAAMMAAIKEGDKATVGSVAFKKGVAPRAMAKWGLEALRGQLFAKGKKVFQDGTKHERRHKPRSMGVISCRSREASLIPNYT